MTKIRAKFPSPTFDLLKGSCVLLFNTKVMEKESQLLTITSDTTYTLLISQISYLPQDFTHWLHPTSSHPHYSTFRSLHGSWILNHTYVSCQFLITNVYLELSSLQLCIHLTEITFFVNIFIITKYFSIQKPRPGPSQAGAKP